MLKYLVIAGVVVAAGLSWWLLDSYQPGRRPAAANLHHPDAYMENFVATNMNEQGLPRNRLQAKSMIRFMDDDSTEVSKPHITIYNDGLPPWNIVSESGWVSPDRELILLLGQVEIDRAGGDSLRPVTITTRDLRVRPQNDYAETDETVVIESERNLQIGTGMRAFFKPPVRIELLSKVRGKYEVDQL